MLAETKTTFSVQQSNKLKNGLPRLLEAFAAIGGLIVSAPLLALSALGVALTSRGGVLFRQERVGRYGRTFIFYKLRTMKATSTGPNVTMSNDARITAVGKWLRKTKLDELPALWNVLKGDMSLVGPRPEVPRYVDLKDRMWQAVLQARPGITDPVTLRLRNEEELLASVEGDPEEFYLRTLQPLKLKGYMEYLQRRDWRSDLGILWRSVMAIVIPFEAPPPTVNENVAKASGLPYPLAKLRSRWGQHLLDLTVLSLAFALSYLLRYEFSIPKKEVPNELVQIVFVVFLQYLALYLTGVRKFIWRYIGMAEIGVFARAALLSFIPLLMLRILLPKELQAGRVPISIIVMDTLLAFAGVLLLRVSRRALYERYEKRKISTHAISGHKKPVLLIGAGRAGVMAAKEINGRGDMDLDIRGFIDDELGKQGSVIHGVRVCGTPLDLPRLVKELGIDHVVLTIAQASTQEIRRIVDICDRIPVRVRMIPGLYEILGGQVEVNRIRDIHMEDLLASEPVEVDEESIQALLERKVVMITGAGGVIGSELARQVTQYKPSKLLLLDRAEVPLLNIHQELSALRNEVTLAPLLTDAGNTVRMRTVFKEHRPQVILHAAAHRQETIIEVNPIEAIKNNVLTTHSLGKLAGEFGVQAFILISSFKAMNLNSVTGTSKRMAELALQNLDRHYPQTRFVAVRFGEVTGGASSFIPVFREQIKRGGPITIAHEKTKRYPMTAPGVTRLTLQCAAMEGQGELFVLGMGTPISILDLARETIIRSGLRPEIDVKIEVTRMRPDEELLECPELDKESLSQTNHPMIFTSDFSSYSEEKVAQMLEELTSLAENGEEQELRRFLSDIFVNDKSNGTERSSPLEFEPLSTS